MYHNLYLYCRFTFKNKNNITVRIINYGGIITDICVPDKNGKVADINLGFDDIKGRSWGKNPTQITPSPKKTSKQQQKLVIIKSLQIQYILTEFTINPIIQIFFNTY